MIGRRHTGTDGRASPHASPRRLNTVELRPMYYRKSLKTCCWQGAMELGLFLRRKDLTGVYNVGAVRGAPSSLDTGEDFPRGPEPRGQF